MELDFAVDGLKYVSLKPLEYKGIKIPKDFHFDGVTIIAPFGFLFSNKDLLQGLRASCFHDFMCQHKDIYSRKQATKILIEIWREDGLEEFKAVLVKFAVNVFQIMKGWF